MLKIYLIFPISKKFQERNVHRKVKREASGSLIWENPKKFYDLKITLEISFLQQICQCYVKILSIQFS